MSFLLKPPNKTLNPLSILRRFSTKPFPDNPTSSYYDNLVTEAGTTGNLHALRDILNKRVQDVCFNTKRTFSFITNTNFTPTLLNDVVHTLQTLTPGFTRKSAFDSLITRLCHLKLPHHALTIAESMARDFNCTPSACTFYPILNLLTRTKSFDHARRVVELMARLGVRLDLTARNYFLMAHAAAGDLGAVAGVLREMEEEGMRGDARTFDALVLGACGAGRVDGAMVLVRRMVGDGVPMLYSTHMFVIGGLLEMGWFEQAVRYVRCFGGKDEVLDAEIFGCLGSKLLKLKRVEEALLVLEEMEQRGLPMGSKLRRFYEKNAGSGKGRSSG